MVRDGEPQPEVVETYLTNSRLPDLVEMDLRAQIASANVARERLHELIRRYGLQAVVDALADVLDYAQVLFARTLTKLPDGDWYGEDHIDHDGHRPGRFTVRCWARIRGDRLELDFRGSDPQSAGFINTTYAGALAGAYTALFPYLCPDIPWNAGVLRQVKVLVEEGTVHHARFPAPVGFGVVHATHCPPTPPLKPWESAWPRPPATSGGRWGGGQALPLSTTSLGETTGASPSPPCC